MPTVILKLLQEWHLVVKQNPVMALVFCTGSNSICIIISLLPTLNLVNINTSRILERASEIGVRKAFGASSKTLVLQLSLKILFSLYLADYWQLYFLRLF